MCRRIWKRYLSHMSRDMTKLTKWLCAQRTLRSAWASAQSDQSFRWPHEEAWVLSYPLSAQRRLWSDWADAEADLSLRLAHSDSVGFVMSRLIYAQRRLRRAYVSAGSRHSLCSLPPVWKYGTRGSFRQRAWYVAPPDAFACVLEGSRAGQHHEVDSITSWTTLRSFFSCESS